MNNQYFSLLCYISHIIDNYIKLRVFTQFHNSFRKVKGRDLFYLLSNSIFHVHFCTEIRDLTIRMYIRIRVWLRHQSSNKADERNFCVSGRTSLGPLLRDENINGNLTDGDDELLESLVKTATKTPATRTTPRERKRTRHADRKSCKCDPRTLHLPSLLPRWSICPRFFLEKIDRLLANSFPACSPRRIYGPISSRTRGVSFQAIHWEVLTLVHGRCCLTRSLLCYGFWIERTGSDELNFPRIFLRIVRCCNIV